MRDRTENGRNLDNSNSSSNFLPMVRARVVFLLLSFESPIIAAPSVALLFIFYILLLLRR